MDKKNELYLTSFQDQSSFDEAVKKEAPSVTRLKKTLTDFHKNEKFKAIEQLLILVAKNPVTQPLHKTLDSFNAQLGILTELKKNNFSVLKNISIDQSDQHAQLLEVFRKILRDKDEKLINLLLTECHADVIIQLNAGLCEQETNPKVWTAWLTCLCHHPFSKEKPLDFERMILKLVQCNISLLGLGETLLKNLSIACLLKCIDTIRTNELIQKNPEKKLPHGYLPSRSTLEILILYLHNYLIKIKSQEKIKTQDNIKEEEQERKERHDDFHNELNKNSQLSSFILSKALSFSIQSPALILFVSKHNQYYHWDEALTLLFLKALSDIFRDLKNPAERIQIINAAYSFLSIKSAISITDNLIDQKYPKEHLHDELKQALSDKYEGFICNFLSYTSLRDSNLLEFFFEKIEMKMLCSWIGHFYTLSNNPIYAPFFPYHSFCQTLIKKISTPKISDSAVLNIINALTELPGEARLHFFETLSNQLSPVLLFKIALNLYKKNPGDIVSLTQHTFLSLDGLQKQTWLKELSTEDFAAVYSDALKEHNSELTISIKKEMTIFCQNKDAAHLNKLKELITTTPSIDSTFLHATIGYLDDATFVNLMMKLYLKISGFPVYQNSFQCFLSHFCERMKTSYDSKAPIHQWISHEKAKNIAFELLKSPYMLKAILDRSVYQKYTQYIEKTPILGFLLTTPAEDDAILRITRCFTLVNLSEKEAKQIAFSWLMGFKQTPQHFPLIDIIQKLETLHERWPTEAKNNFSLIKTACVELLSPKKDLKDLTPSLPLLGLLASETASAQMTLLALNDSNNPDPALTLTQCTQFVEVKPETLIPILKKSGCEPYKVNWDNLGNYFLTKDIKEQQSFIELLIEQFRDEQPVLKKIALDWILHYTKHQQLIGTLSVNSILFIVENSNESILNEHIVPWFSQLLQKKKSETITQIHRLLPQKKSWLLKFYHRKEINNFLGSLFVAIASDDNSEAYMALLALPTEIDETLREHIEIILQEVNPKAITSHGLLVLTHFMERINLSAQKTNDEELLIKYLRFFKSASLEFSKSPKEASILLEKNKNIISKLRKQNSRWDDILLTRDNIYPELFAWARNIPDNVREEHFLTILLQENSTSKIPKEFHLNSDYQAVVYHFLCNKVFQIPEDNFICMFPTLSTDNQKTLATYLFSKNIDLVIPLNVWIKLGQSLSITELVDLLKKQNPVSSYCIDILFSHEKCRDLPTKEHTFFLAYIKNKNDLLRILTGFNSEETKIFFVHCLLNRWLDNTASRHQKFFIMGLDPKTLALIANFTVTLQDKELLTALLQDIPTFERKLLSFIQYPSSAATHEKESAPEQIAQEVLPDFLSKKGSYLDDLICQHAINPWEGTLVHQKFFPYISAEHELTAITQRVELLQQIEYFKELFQPLADHDSVALEMLLSLKYMFRLPNIISCLKMHSDLNTLPQIDIRSLIDTKGSLKSPIEQEEQTLEKYLPESIQQFMRVAKNDVHITVIPKSFNELNQHLVHAHHLSSSELDNFLSFYIPFLIQKPKNLIPFCEFLLKNSWFMTAQRRHITLLLQNIPTEFKNIFLESQLKKLKSWHIDLTTLTMFLEKHKDVSFAELIKQLEQQQIINCRNWNATCRDLQLVHLKNITGLAMACHDNLINDDRTITSLALPKKSTCNNEWDWIHADLKKLNNYLIALEEWEEFLFVDLLSYHEKLPLSSHITLLKTNKLHLEKLKNESSVTEIFSSFQMAIESNSPIIIHELASLILSYLIKKGKPHDFIKLLSNNMITSFFSFMVNHADRYKKDILWWFTFNQDQNLIDIIDKKLKKLSEKEHDPSDLFLSLMAIKTFLNAKETLETSPNNSALLSLFHCDALFLQLVYRIQDPQLRKKMADWLLSNAGIQFYGDAIEKQAPDSPVPWFIIRLFFSIKFPEEYSKEEHNFIEILYQKLNSQPKDLLNDYFPWIWILLSERKLHKTFYQYLLKQEPPNPFLIEWVSNLFLFNQFLNRKEKKDILEIIPMEVLKKIVETKSMITYELCELFATDEELFQKQLSNSEHLLWLRSIINQNLKETEQIALLKLSQPGSIFQSVIGFCFLMQYKRGDEYKDFFKIQKKPPISPLKKFPQKIQYKDIPLSWIDDLPVEVIKTLFFTVSFFSQINEAILKKILSSYTQNNFLAVSEKKSAIIQWISYFVEAPNAFIPLIELFNQESDIILEYLKKTSPTTEKFLELIIEHSHRLISFSEDKAQNLAQIASETLFYKAVDLYLMDSKQVNLQHFLSAYLTKIKGQTHNIKTLEALIKLSAFPDFQKAIPINLQEKLWRQAATTNDQSLFLVNGNTNIQKLITPLWEKTEPLMLPNHFSFYEESVAILPDIIHCFDYFLANAKEPSESLRNTLKFYIHQIKSNNQAQESLSAILCFEKTSAPVKKIIYDEIQQYLPITTKEIAAHLVYYAPKDTLSILTKKLDLTALTLLAKNILLQPIFTSEKTKPETAITHIKKLIFESETEEKLSQMKGIFLSLRKRLLRCRHYGWHGFFKPNDPEFISLSGKKPVPEFNEFFQEIRLDTEEASIEQLFIRNLMKTPFKVPLTDEVQTNLIDIIKHPQKKGWSQKDINFVEQCRFRLVEYFLSINDIEMIKKLLESCSYHKPSLSEWIAHIEYRDDFLAEDPKKEIGSTFSGLATTVTNKLTSFTSNSYSFFPTWSDLKNAALTPIKLPITIAQNAYNNITGTSPKKI